MEHRFIAGETVSKEVTGVEVRGPIGESEPIQTTRRILGRVQDDDGQNVCVFWETGEILVEKDRGTLRLETPHP